MGTSRGAILVAEDSNSARKLIARTLSREGYETVEAADGLEAVKAFRQGAFDLVLMDANMPVVDGFKACSEIKRHPKGKAVPIIMVTALDDASSVEQAFSVGAEEYIPKPINWAVLLRRIHLIIENRRAHDEVEESHARMEGIVNTAADSIIVISKEGVIEAFNQAAEKAFGYASREVIGNNISILMPSPFREAHDGYLRRYLETGEKKAMGLRPEVIAQRKDGGQFPVELSISEVRLRNRHLFTGIVRDITERKEAEKRAFFEKRAEDLEVLKRNLEIANQAKADFLAVISHEMRTPLNSVIGFSDLLLGNPDLQPGDRELVQMVLDSGTGLLGNINDIIEFVQLDPNSFTLSKKGFNLRKLVEESVGSIAREAEAKGLALGFDVTASVPDVVHGDARRLGQVLRHLLANGVKFTEKGRVTLTVDSPDAIQADSVMLRFTVEDTGCGIPAPKLKSIFKQFTQVEEPNTRKYGGLGLGLAICKKLVGLMAGKLEVVRSTSAGTAIACSVNLSLVDPQA